jgi:ABC-2 type transport system ATP-binding protein
MAFMNVPAVRIDNLSFRYPGQLHNSITGINLTVAAGDRFGLFGPNGAGKTTLMGCMTGILNFTDGSIEIFGEKVSRRNRSFCSILGYVPQEYSFYQELDPLENLEYFGALSGLKMPEIKKKSEELLKVLGLWEVRNKQVEKFSGGMKRRVNIAISIMHEPRILFLDEPTVGVDVQTRFAIMDYLVELNRRGTTLVYTSHQLAEAQNLCNSFALIDQGSIIAHDTLEHLLATHEAEGLEGLFIKLTGKAYRDSDV